MSATTRWGSLPAALLPPVILRPPEDGVTNLNTARFSDRGEVSPAFVFFLNGKHKPAAVTADSRWSASLAPNGTIATGPCCGQGPKGFSEAPLVETEKLRPAGASFIAAGGRNKSTRGERAGAEHTPSTNLHLQICPERFEACMTGKQIAIRPNRNSRSVVK